MALFCDIWGWNYSVLQCKKVHTQLIRVSTQGSFVGFFILFLLTRQKTNAR
jgi:hypothetical protein